MKNRIQIIQGGQYGSEAKGAIAAYLCQKENITYAVRTGATNAGHTVQYGGVKVAMQQLPVGFVNPGTRLVLGAGALIDPAILRREIALISQLTGEDVRRRLHIDYRATVHLPIHAARSRAEDRHHLIGATGKGCSEALMDRIRLRGKQPLRLSDMPEYRDLPFEDTARMLNRDFDAGASIQLEGTQGQMLDLYLGPWPYTTHKPTSPGMWMAEAGLSPALPTDIVMVLRTYPIRVAGNSGPMPYETSWPTLAREINHLRADAGLSPIVAEPAIQEFEEACLEQGSIFRAQDKMPRGIDGLSLHTMTADQRLYYREAASELHKRAIESLPSDVVDELSKLFEFTTVTKKLRRIARFSTVTVREAVAYSRPHRVAVTFMNYRDPVSWFDGASMVSQSEWAFLEMIGDITDAKVQWINRGPNPEHILEVQ